MTQRELPRRGVSQPTTMAAPTISASVGTWAFGLADHITDDEKHRMMLMFGLTISPDVLEVNGNRHEIRDRLDSDTE